MQSTPSTTLSRRNVALPDSVGHPSGRHAAAGPLHQRRPDPGQGGSTEEIPQAIDQITELLRERHRILPGDDDDFNIRDMTEITKTLSSTSAIDEHACCWSWR